MKLPPSRANNRKRGVFCNSNCYGEWLSETVVGEDHRQWEGGTLDYGQKWWRIRREALERDGYTRQKCGKMRKESDENRTYTTLLGFAISTGPNMRT